MKSKQKASQSKKPNTRHVAEPATEPQSRQLQQQKRSLTKPASWRRAQKQPRSHAALPKAHILMREALDAVFRGKTVFGGILGFYALGLVLLVQGLPNPAELLALKDVLSTTLNGFIGGAESIIVQLTYLFGGATNAPATAGIYQTILTLLISLAIIWSLREIHAKRLVTLKDSFYKSMEPLIPFLLVIMLFGLQLLPMSIGAFLYEILVGGGIAVSSLEQILVLMIALILTFVSLRLITPTIFALFIVTLPGMIPLKAYRSSSELVDGRRLLIWRKLMYLPIMLFVALLIVMIPVMLFATVLAPFVFVVFSLIAHIIAISYLYSLYRSLLQ